MYCGSGGHPGVDGLWLAPLSAGSVVDMPWQADWQCDNLIAPDGTDFHSFAIGAQPPGVYTATIKLLFRTFPPHFLTRLEVEAGLDPAVNGRVETVEMASEQFNFVIN